MRFRAFRRRCEGGKGISQNTHLFYGAEGYSDSIHSTNLGDHTRGRVAAYAALDTRALNRFSFNIGAREEVYRSVQGQFSPSISAGYWLNSHLKFRGNVSHAFRVPSLTDLYYHDPTSVGSPNLRPERAWDLETGLEWNGRRRLHGDLTLFQLARAGRDRLHAQTLPRQSGRRPTSIGFISMAWKALFGRRFPIRKSSI